MRTLTRKRNNIITSSRRIKIGLRSKNKTNKRSKTRTRITSDLNLILTVNGRRSTTNIRSHLHTRNMNLTKSILLLLRRTKINLSHTLHRIGTIHTLKRLINQLIRTSITITTSTRGLRITMTNLNGRTIVINTYHINININTVQSISIN